MPDQTIADIAKNGRERVRVSLSEYRGSVFADVRLFTTGADGAIVPTPKGVAIRPDMLRQVIVALEQAETETIRRGVRNRGGRA